MSKSEPVFAKEGIPRFLTSFLIDLETRVDEAYGDKAFKKSASPTNAKSLNGMKQGLKKWMLANESQAARVKAFRENPKLAEEEDVKPKHAATSAKKASGDHHHHHHHGHHGSAHTASGARSGGAEDSEEDEDDAKAAKVKLVGRAKWVKKSDDSSSSSDSDDDNDWLDDDDDEGGDDVDGGDDDMLALGRKKPTMDSDEDESSDEEEGEDGGKKKKKKSKEAKEEKKEQEWTPERIDEKFKELVARRGTRSYDRVKQVMLLAYLFERAKEKAATGERLLRILFALIDALFDVNQNMYAHMNVKVWKYAYNTIVRVFELMTQYASTIEVVDYDPMMVATTATSAKKDKRHGKDSSTPASLTASSASVSASEASSTDGAKMKVRGLVLPQLERLDDEYFKSLQLMDPHTQDYVARMRHEPALLRLLKIGMDFFDAKGEPQKSASLAARRLDHLYYRRETEGASQRAALREAQRAIASQAQEAQMERDQKQNDDSLRDSTDSIATTASLESAAASSTSTVAELPDEELLIIASNAGYTAAGAKEPAASKNSSSNASSQQQQAQTLSEDVPLVELVPHLCALVYASNDVEARIKAVLQHIYHLALHDKYFEARDRLLATRMQEEIANAPGVPMHIAYNRALVQLGLAAFRKGRISDANNALSEIVGPRIKEFLAQGLIIKNVDRTAEQEKLERKRQMPYPMHINLDLIEFVHLTSAMLLEVPNMAAKPGQQDLRKRQMKTFRKILESSERQTFTGPPENTKDHVIAAAKALAQSDWSRSCELLLHLDIWKLIPKADEVKALLKKRVQEEALRTHLFSNAQYYETIRLDQLVDTFQLPKHSVHAIVSKMMMHDELAASWDQPSESIVMNASAAPSPLQNLALLYADRISALFSDTDGDSRQGGQGGQGGQPQQSGGSQQGSQSSHFGASSQQSGSSQQGGQGSQHKGPSGDKRRDNRGGQGSDRNGPRNSPARGGNKQGGGKKRN